MNVKFEIRDLRSQMRRLSSWPRNLRQTCDMRVRATRPHVILDQLETLEAEITSDLQTLRGMLS